MSSDEFENVAFSLQNKNDVSKPFQSPFGWHIVKLIDRHALQTLPEMKLELEEKVRRDERSLLITNSLSKKLRAKYTFVKNQKMLSAVKKIVTKDFYAQTWEVPEKTAAYNDVILTINKAKEVSAIAFLNYIQLQQKLKIKTAPISNLIDELFEKFIDEQLIAYYNENLENEFPEFKYIMDEYRDGLLLFDLMEKEIWTKAKTDTLGMTNYFEKNIKNYQWKKRYNVNIFSSTDKAIVAKAKKYLSKGKSVTYIKEQLNKDGKINIMVKSGIFEEDYDILPTYTNLSKGISDVATKDQYHFVVEVLEVKEIEAKKLSECTGKVVNDYQQFLEAHWVDELKKEFKIQVNSDVFETVKKQLHK